MLIRVGSATPEASLIVPSWISTSQLRAEFPEVPGDCLSVEFEYHGWTQETIPLANGEVRSQFGIMLRRQNTCNLLYLMCRFSGNKLCYSAKINPGQETHEECGDAGYINNKSTQILSLDRSYVLRAEHINGLTRATLHNGAGYRVADLTVAQKLPSGWGTGIPGLRADNAMVRLIRVWQEAE